MDSPREPSSRPDVATYVTRFICGALFGPILAIPILIFLTRPSDQTILIVLGVTVILSGVLAAVHGDRVWFAAKDWF